MLLRTLLIFSNYSEYLGPSSMSNSTETGDSRDEAIAQIRIAVLCLCLVFTLGGNLLVFVVILKNKPKAAHHPSHIYKFMLHLSLADILVGIFNILPQLVWDIYFRFRWGNVACKFIKFMQVFVLYLSTYILVGLALDRYIVVRSGKNKLCLKFILLASWLVAGILAAPQLYIFSLQQLPKGVYDCWGTFEPPITELRYVVYFVIMALILPAALMGLCYSYLCWATSKRLMSDAKLKTVNMTMVMVLVFVLCWTPFCYSQLYYAFTGSKPSTFNTLCLLVPNLNSCANPWVYLHFSSNLRKHLQELLPFMKIGGSAYSRTYQRQQVATTRPNGMQRPSRQIRAYRSPYPNEANIYGRQCTLAICSKKDIHFHSDRCKPPNLLVVQQQQHHHQPMSIE